MIEAGKPSLSLVVPLYNEEERVAEHAGELADFIAGYGAGSQLLFVDDGSTDRTIEVVEDFIARRPDVEVQLVRRPHEGKGAAVRAGLEQATADYAGFCDVDLATPLDQFELILEAAARAPVLAIGSRDVAASRLVRHEGPVREWLGKSFNRLVQFAVTPGISDTQCGAKAASTDVWQAILPRCQQAGFAWDVEAIAVARRLGILVREVAIAWTHDDRTRVRVGRDGAAMVASLPVILRSAALVGPEERFTKRLGEVSDDPLAGTLVEWDFRHWWFRSKAAHVASVLRFHAQPGPPPMLVDVGAGAGGVTATLGWPTDRLVTLEADPELARVGLHRHGLAAGVAIANQLPITDGAAGVVALLDVLEHLDDPVPTLAEVHRALGNGGQLVLTLPAHRWLWSHADEVNGHRRRYSTAQVRRMVGDAGFEPMLTTHIFSWLVPAALLRRRRGTSADLGKLFEGTSSLLMDRAALVLTRVERSLIRRTTLPVGTSILCLAAKTEEAGAGPDDPR